MQIGSAFIWSAVARHRFQFRPPPEIRPHSWNPCRAALRNLEPVVGVRGAEFKKPVLVLAFLIKSFVSIRG